MFSMLNTTIRTVRRSNNSNPLWFFLGIGVILLFIVIIIKVIGSEERKDDDQFDEIHYQSENFRLLKSMMNESVKYYRINRIKNTFVFLSAIIACFFGLYIAAFHNNLLDYIFGTISEFVSATFFWIYKQCQKEERYYYDRLFSLKKILIAIALSNSSKNKKQKTDNEKIIDVLLENQLK